jgi:hypothetical protein
MEQLSSTGDPQPEVSKPPTMSLAGRLFNVYATPGDVFDEVATAPVSAANWFAPALILLAVSWISVFLIFSQESIKHQLSEMTAAAIQKQVDQHHLSEQQAEQARQAGEKWAGISSRVGGFVGPLFAAFLTPFWWGLILWMVGAKVFKTQLAFMKAVEVAGLANMIGVLDAVLRTLLILGMGNLFASPSLALLVKDFDPQNTYHSLLSLVSVMTFWVLAVRSIGLSRLTGVSCVKAAVWVFGIWAAYTGFFLGLGAAIKLALKRVTG